MRTKNIAAPLAGHGICSVLAHVGPLLLMVISYWLSQTSMANGDYRLVVYSPIDLVTFVERTEQGATHAVQAIKTTDAITVREAVISKETVGAAQATETIETIHAKAVIEVTEAKEKIEAKDTTAAKEITQVARLTKAIKQRTASEVATSVAKKITAPSSEMMGMSNDRLKQTAPSAESIVQQTARPDHARNPKPDYPVALRDRGLSGVVRLRVWVDAAGRPREIKLAKGSGYRLFDESALRAVQQWRFIPAKNDYQSLASWVEFAVRFVING